MQGADSRNISAEQKILSGVDQLAAEDLIGEATTRLIARFSGLSEEVMLRHIPDKEATLNRWLDTRGDRLQGLLRKVEPGRPGLMSLLRELLGTPALLGLLFCHPMGDVALRTRMESLRKEVMSLFLEKLNDLDGLPDDVSKRVLLDQLWAHLKQAWDVRNPDQEKERHTLFEHLPWESDSAGESTAYGSQKSLLPEPEQVGRIAISDSGFLFDPVSGHSFTTNETGLFILKQLREGGTLSEVVSAITDQYEVENREAERDLLEFAGQMRELIL